MSLSGRFTAVAGTVGVLVTAGAVAATLLAQRDRGRQEVVVLATADTYVTEAKPDESYGRARQLRADAAPSTVRSYLMFEVPELDRPIVAAHLRLYANTPDRVGVLVATVTPSTGGEPWTESTTWRTAPPVSEPVAQGRPVDANEWTEVDLSAYVRPGRLDLALLSIGETMVNYSSRDDGPDTAPRLVLRTSK
jgi:hypothetical protein